MPRPSRSRGRPPAPPRRRNPQVLAMRRLGHRIKPSAKRYRRKGRIADPALDVSGH